VAATTKSPTDPTDRWLSPPPPTKARPAIVAFIWLFLAWQAAVPAMYYVRGEPTSERFAWRMFSSVHMSDWRCQVKETRSVDGRPVEQVLPLERFLQESTLVGLQQGQLDLAEAFLRKRMSEPGVSAVDYEAGGTWPSGNPLPPVRLHVGIEAATPSEAAGP
jgi:hypothetical protein